MRHVTLMDVSRHTCENENLAQVNREGSLAHHRSSLDMMHMNETCHTFACVMSYISRLIQGGKDS